MTDTQLDAATKIRASINHYREMLELVSDMTPGGTEWPYNDEEYIRLATPPHQRLMDLYRQRIAELEKQFAEV